MTLKPTAHKPVTQDLVPSPRLTLWVRLRRFWPRVPIYGALIVLGTIFAIPLVWLVSSSLKLESKVFTYPPEFIPNPVVFSNYSEAVTRFPFWQATKNTMVIVLACLVGNLFTVSFTAYVFARIRFPGREPMFVFMVLATLMVPYHVYLIPQYILFRNLGWLNSNLPLTVPALMAQSPYFIFMFRQFFRSVPREYDEAARIDGCGWFGIYWRIMLPQSLPALGVVAIFTFIGTWNDFLAPLIYLNEQRKQTLTIAIRTYEMLASEVHLGQSSWTFILAVSVILTIPPIVLYFVAQRYFVQGIVVSGVKG
ncbi:MAG: carbohydrate ABC transporter permease [Chloroflexi bacterium]|nr:carbohydrate ABC transporter permease [Chloroflexota bacterium]